MSRDTQFQHFAELLWDELREMNVKGTNGIDVYHEQCKAIAQRSYDLVLHTVENVDMVDLARLFRQEIAERIPDMTELPKEQE